MTATIPLMVIRIASQSLGFEGSCCHPWRILTWSNCWEGFVGGKTALNQLPHGLFVLWELYNISIMLMCLCECWCCCPPSWGGKKNAPLITFKCWLKLSFACNCNLHGGYTTPKLSIIRWERGSPLQFFDNTSTTLAFTQTHDNNVNVHTHRKWTNNHVSNQLSQMWQK
jgi:hypothetical protein